MSIPTSHPSEAAAWAQALVSGVAIVISGAIAVFVPWNERRLDRKRDLQARLDVECRSPKSGGLELLFIYRPEFHNASLSIDVTVREPSGAKLYKGQMLDLDSDDSDFRGKPTTLGQRDVRRNALTLMRRRDRNDYRGMMFIKFDDGREGPHSARIHVRVLKHGNYIISESKLRLTSQDAIYWEKDAPVAVFAKSFDGWR